MRERPQGRPSLRLLAGLPLSEPFHGRARCAVCGLRSRRLRILHYRSRPWADAYRTLPKGALVHFTCATIPDEALELEVPRSWLLRPVSMVPPLYLVLGDAPPERMYP